MYLYPRKKKTTMTVPKKEEKKRETESTLLDANQTKSKTYSWR